jgi:hypothetical protein
MMLVNKEKIFLGFRIPPLFGNIVIFDISINPYNHDTIYYLPTPIVDNINSALLGF